MMCSIKALQHIKSCWYAFYIEDLQNIVILQCQLQSVLGSIFELM